MSNNVSLMKTAVGSALSNVFPNAIRMTCIPHALNLILEEWPRLFDSLNTIVAPIKSFCCQSTLNFVSQGFMNSGVFKIFEWATSSNRSHTIGVNYLCIALSANSDNLLKEKNLWNLRTGSFVKKHFSKMSKSEQQSSKSLCAPTENMF